MAEKIGAVRSEDPNLPLGYTFSVAVSTRWPDRFQFSSICLIVNGNFHQVLEAK